MLTYIIGIIVFVLILGIIVLLHEGGHFILAKRAGIMCYEFAIGMGPIIYQWRKGETVYSIRAIPIGGFVSMAGEEVESNILTGYSKCQLVLENNKVVKIIVDEKNFDTEMPVYKLIKNDLIGSKEKLEDELYIDVEDENGNSQHFIVKRDAFVAFPKKQTYQIAPYERNFVNKSIGQRFLAVFAGPAMNFVLAVFVFFILGLCRGYADPNVTYVDGIVKDTPAYEAGLRDGDEILYIGTEDVKNIKEEDYFTKWDDISQTLLACANGENKNFVGTLNVIYRRGGEVLTTVAYPNSYINSISTRFKRSTTDNNNLVIDFSNIEGIKEGDILVSVNGIKFTKRSDVLTYFYSQESQTNIEDGKIVYNLVVNQDGEEKEFRWETLSIKAFEDNGIAPAKVQMEFTAEYQFNLLKNLYMPFVETGESALLVFKTLGLLFTDKTVGLSDLSGPIGILDATVSMISITDAEGNIDFGGIIISLLNWIGMLSVNIGLLNLLPLPALDGGRLAFIAYEAVTKKKASPKVENIVHSIGFILLMILFVFVAFNDVLRLFG